ncbi:MAG: sugar phosphate nucleotidyltransferase [Anaerolineae bacterium]|nr:sugar phosphate nucleotidyltransferase [Anaerolineae bacterium]
MDGGHQNDGQYEDQNDDRNGGHQHCYAVVMAGGGGTRLWPLSRKQHPKQTLSLVEERSLFQTSLDRLLPLLPLERIFVVTAGDQVDGLHAQYTQLPRANFIVEPLGRGTAACIGLAALHISRLDPEAVMIVVTADHHIQDHDAFTRALEAASAVAQDGYLVTLGVTPTFPSTGYGYIRFGDNVGNVAGFHVFEVDTFVEKPDVEAAERFVAAGNYAWNSGMFVWRADRILAEIALWMPELHEILDDLGRAWGTEAYLGRLSALWPTLRKETIDYGIMERAQRVAVVPVDIGWSDIGTWDTVMAAHTPDGDGNVLLGDVLQIETENSMAVAQGGRLIALVGVDDLIVVDTPDAVFITRRGLSQQVRDVVKRLEEGRGARYL